MQIIGVIDLLGGRAVHAQGGCRHGYRAVDVAAGTAVRGDAKALADAYARLGVGDLYVADLDAIAGGATQQSIVRDLVTQGGPVWLDAGVATVAQAQRTAALGPSRVVVGLETLKALSALPSIVAAVGSDRVAFSLDLRDGRPVASDPSMRDETPEAIVRGAVDAGVSAVIVLDLARVGSGRGPDCSMMERVRSAAPGIRVLAGGGVRDEEDLRLLGEAGCDGALVATALHGAGGADLVRLARDRTAGHGKVTR